mmetsp:Transcript_24799/g.67720  ORF Transcript_24799/g.67720 Transcript_24799/m.67720 type:complete len:253 (+) Transcript_24799:84-842(+)
MYPRRRRRRSFQDPRRWSRSEASNCRLHYPSHGSPGSSGGPPGHCSFKLRRAPDFLEAVVPAVAWIGVGDLRRRVLLVGLEICQVIGGLHLRHVRSCHRPCVQRLPVEAAVLEPRMLLHGLAAVLSHRQPLAGILLAEALDQARPIAARREVDKLHAARDLAENVDGVLRAEGRVRHHQLVDQHAERPPVHGVGVPEAQDHLRRKVVRGATRGVAVPDDKLCEAKVGNLAVALRVEEQVLRLQIAVGHSADS